MAFFPVGAQSIETVYAHPPAGGTDRTILDRLIQMIEDTPAGGAIHATIFRLNDIPARDALVAANNRGVVVHVVHNGRDVADGIAATLSRNAPIGLGPWHRWTGRPYDPTSDIEDFGAIATGDGSDMHTKLFLFSATRDPDRQLRKHVSWWSSANLSDRSGTAKSNNTVVVYDDPVLFDGFRHRLWDLMWHAVHFPNNDFYDASSDRGMFLGSPATKTKVFCSPQQSTDLWIGRLGSVVAEPGARVDVAQARFVDRRLVVAERLASMAQQGAAVRVLVSANPALLGPTVRQRLLDAGIALRTSNIHDKLVLVDARHGVSTGRRKIVFSGSHNFNYDATYRNDEILVKTFNDELYDDMLGAHFEPIWAAGTEVTAETPAYGTDDRPVVEATGGEMP